MNKPGSLIVDHMAVIYVMAPDENGPCKIGVTNNLQSRLMGIQVGCWLPLRVYAARIAFRRDASMTTILKSAEAGAFRLESMCHTELKKCGVHLSGEWFDVTAEEAIQAIIAASKGKNISALSIEDVASLDVSECQASVQKVYRQICASLLAANKFIREGLDKNSGMG